MISNVHQSRQIITTDGAAMRRYSGQPLVASRSDQPAQGRRAAGCARTCARATSATSARLVAAVAFHAAAAPARPQGRTRTNT